MQDWVVGLGYPGVLYALDVINQAIKRGYDATTKELRTKNYDPRVSKTAFAQALHHNVNQEVYDIGGNLPEIVTDLPPNPTRSHHHVMAVVENVCIRVSAVKKSHQVPRYAAYRSRFGMMQSYFRVNAQGCFEIVDVPDPYDPGSVYIQILHGSSPGTPHKHGFTVFRVMELNNRYSQKVIDLDEFLAFAATINSDLENVTEDFDIPIISLEGALQDENR